jgi:hypothetical protein
MVEKLLNIKVCEYFKSENEIVLSEVPFMNRKIDLVCYNNKILTTYELKIKNWRKAIEQMLDHSIAANFCYLCMPYDGKNNLLLNKIRIDLKRYGFGLILWDDFNNNIIEDLPAKESIFRNQLATNKLIQNVDILSNCRN